MSPSRLNFLACSRSSSPPWAVWSRMARISDATTAYASDSRVPRFGRVLTRKLRDLTMRFFAWIHSTGLSVSSIATLGSISGLRMASCRRAFSIP